jgi:hypothetical protein
LLICIVVAILLALGNDVKVGSRSTTCDATHLVCVTRNNNKIHSKDIKATRRE